jgi:hypothetical protein
MIKGFQVSIDHQTSSDWPKFGVFRGAIFALGRLQSSLPKALESLFLSLGVDFFSNCFAKIIDSGVASPKTRVTTTRQGVYNVFGPFVFVISL